MLLIILCARNSILHAGKSANFTMHFGVKITSFIKNFCLLKVLLWTARHFSPASWHPCSRRRWPTSMDTLSQCPPSIIHLRQCTIINHTGNPAIWMIFYNIHFLVSRWKLNSLLCKLAQLFFSYIWSKMFPWPLNYQL